MHTIEDMLVEKNYSRCPLKKRPVNYQFEAEDCKPTSESKITLEQPQNLSLKKESPTDMITSQANEATNTLTTTDDINVSDCCEDEGVDVDHRTDDEDEDIDCEDEDDEMIDCVDIEEEDELHAHEHKTTQAAALAAAAAAAAAATAVTASALIVPTPTYPKYGLQPWNFHMSPYTAEFYRTINNPHLAAATPLRGELLSPSSPSDSIGSLSPPPPHYLHGRASSVSPPMRTEIIHRPIGVRQMPQSPTSQQHQHRFMPYPTLPAYPQHATHPHHHTQQHAYPLSYHPAIPHHHAPISPAYSESSYYSMRSLTPESNCSSLPEDLSVKHQSALSLKSVTSLNRDEALHATTNASSNVTKVSSLCSTGSNSSSSSKKDKNAPPRYQCPDCQKSYSTFSGLTKHQQFHCPAAEGNQVKKSFSCKDCEKTYVSLGALKMHIRTHTLPCKCNICGKAFSRPWLLQGHIRTHTGEKPFSCQHCHRAFADRSNLRAHLQTHSDIKKYSCTNCSKTFSRMSLLTKHSEGGCPGGAVSSSCASSVNELSSYSAVYAEH